MLRKPFLLTVFVGLVLFAKAQNHFTRADTLRGSIGKERSWWNVLRYDIHLKPQFQEKYVSGTTVITYQITGRSEDGRMQIDLQQPLNLTSVIYDGQTELAYTREGNVFHVQSPPGQEGKHQLEISYEGKPHEARNAPWDGGWIFTTDSLGRPWMTVACQGLGASVWFPCKDHQSDEPDSGATISVTTPQTLQVVANGRRQQEKLQSGGLKTTVWKVQNPINNYGIVPYIGYYQSVKQDYNGEKGSLDVTLWALDYHLNKAKTYLSDQVQKTLEAGEFWFGAYPFYEDGYQLVEAPHLGMEHQSAIAYGNNFQWGYLSTDLSGTGWGLKWDFIVVHESGHEWFGNSITANDIADMWIQESFTNYFETLFVDYFWGKQAADSYNFGNRKNVENDQPIIAHYGVNQEGSGDMYYKGANMLHSIRHSLDNDSLFRDILRRMGRVFYHQTVDGSNIQHYFSEQAGFDFQSVFDQYLKTIQVPVLEYYFEGNRLYYRYSHCLESFNLPLIWRVNGEKFKISPTTQWQSRPLAVHAFDVSQLTRAYYLKVLEIVR